MQSANLIFPHQLFIQSQVIQNGFPVYLVEEYLFFRQYFFHKQKIAFHRASMQFYASYLRSQGMEVHYIEAYNPLADIRQLILALQMKNISTLHFVDPTDNWLGKRIRAAATKASIKIIIYENPLFLNTRMELTDFFRINKKKFFQTTFYIEERKKRKILIDENSLPLGGKWSFDADNRQKYPRQKTPPRVSPPPANEFYEEAKKYVQQNFKDNPGKLSDQPLYPTDFEATKKWFNDYLQNRFAEFGTYEDAIVGQEDILHHSVLTPMLNVGLITPDEVVGTALAFARVEAIPLNSREGFIRQIIGWREFIRGVYECKGSEQRSKNYWGFTRKIPASFYDGSTGIEPIDQVIKKVLKTGYCHHIERLMVLGNFMLLCEFDPNEVYRWFMELFIDAYDWVMVPNVYGMSQFADGGLMATKPYISGSNYLLKMSDYKKGSWQEIWDGLFWRFMHVHRDFFEKNPRLGMLVKNFDKMPGDKQQHLLATANGYLDALK